MTNWMFAVFNWTTLSENAAHCAHTHNLNFPQLSLSSMKINQRVKKLWIALCESVPLRASFFGAALDKNLV